MKHVTLSTSVLLCTLVIAAPAGAVQFFFDDFNDNDMSDWTQLQLQVNPFDMVPYGHYKYGSRGEDPLENDEARAIKDFDNTALSQTVYLSFQVMHSGGYKNQGGNGYKLTRVFMLNDDGAGYGIYIALDKSGSSGWLGIATTDDFGASTDELPGSEAAFVYTPDFAEHTVEAVWDRNNATMDLYYDGSLMKNVLLDFDQNDLYKNPTKAMLAPRHTNGGWPNWLSTDEVWIGDQANPNVEPTLAQGDANGDLTVDIQDLTALAANWSALPQNEGVAKDWSEGDFNYDWAVDIQDLTALATNWTFPSAPAPEPATLALLAIGGAAVLRRRR